MVRSLPSFLKAVRRKTRERISASSTKLRFRPTQSLVRSLTPSSNQPRWTSMRSSSGPQSRTSSGRGKIMSNQSADLIAYNGKIATQNEQRSMVEAVAVFDGKFLAIGTDREVMAYRGE